MATTIDLIKGQIAGIPALRNLVSSDTPQFKQWDQLTHAILEKKLGKKKADDFPSSFDFWPNHMGPWYDEELKESLLRGLDMAEAYLNGLIQEIELLGEDAPSPVAQTNEQHKNTRFGNITVSGGTLILGDGNRTTQVAVKDLVEALEEEIKEKVPEGEEKQNILHSLKEITTNETFASVAGTVIGEILRRIGRP
jgi:hypothetical protein